MRFISLLLVLAVLSPKVVTVRSASFWGDFFDHQQHVEPPAGEGPSPAQHPFSALSQGSSQGLSATDAAVGTIEDTYDLDSLLSPSDGSSGGGGGSPSGFPAIQAQSISPSRARPDSTSPSGSLMGNSLGSLTLSAPPGPAELDDRSASFASPHPGASFETEGTQVASEMPGPGPEQHPMEHSLDLAPQSHQGGLNADNSFERDVDEVHGNRETGRSHSPMLLRKRGSPTPVDELYEEIYGDRRSSPASPFDDVEAKDPPRQFAGHAFPAEPYVFPINELHVYPGGYGYRGPLDHSGKPSGPGMIFHYWT